MYGGVLPVPIILSTITVVGVAPPLISNSNLISVGVADLKIVENFQLTESEDFEVEESEDTLSILDRYIGESETDLSKERIQNVMRSIYQEACETV